MRFSINYLHRLINETMLIVMGASFFLFAWIRTHVHAHAHKKIPAFCGGDFLPRMIRQSIITTREIGNEDQMRVNKTQHKRTQRIIRENP